MASLSAIATKTVFRGVLKREFPSRDHAVRHFRRVLDAPFPSFRFPGVSARSLNYADVPCELLSVSQPRLTLLHLHGGAFVGGKLATYHPFCSALAKRLRADVVLPDYRLAPENPFPAAPDDCLAVYKALLEYGVDPDRLVITGDSAGGNLALVTLQSARAQGLPLPRSAVLISPGADISGNAASWTENDRSDVMLSRQVIELIGEAYLQGQDPADPRASPIRGDFAGLPPMLVSMSHQECLRDDAYAIAAKVKAAGGDIELLMRPDTPHAWPIFYPMVSEARTDLRRIVSFIEQNLR